MEERVFTTQHNDATEEDKAVHKVAQVSLQLKENNRFVLIQGTYSSDWGDRRENSITYWGDFTENEAHIRCEAQKSETVDRVWDHKMQEGHHNKKTASITPIVFFFQKRVGGLVCPIDHDSLLNSQMKEGEKTHPGAFP